MIDLLAAHYLEALKLQAKAARMHAIFGGKNPHVQSLRVGGVTCSYDINAARISEFRAIVDEVRGFIDTVYLPDAILVAQAYSEWAGLGATNNLLAYGEFPQTASEPASLNRPHCGTRPGDPGDRRCHGQLAQPTAAGRKRLPVMVHDRQRFRLRFE